jgi:hypothetical protein
MRVRAMPLNNKHRFLISLRLGLINLMSILAPRRAAVPARRHAPLFRRFAVDPRNIALLQVADDAKEVCGPADYRAGRTCE